MKEFKMIVASSIRKSEFASFITRNVWVESVKQEFTYIDPEKLKQRNILFQIEAANSRGKLVAGMSEVWHAASQQKGRLLVAERDYIFPGTYQRHDKLILLNDFNKVVMCVSEAIDATIEKVLEMDGDIEFVENGTLRKYGRIVLI